MCAKLTEFSWGCTSKTSSCFLNELHSFEKGLTLLRFFPIYNNIFPIIGQCRSFFTSVVGHVHNFFFFFLKICTWMLSLINVIVLFISVLNAEGKQGFFGKRLNSCSFLVLSFFAQLGDQAKVFSRINLFFFSEKSCVELPIKNSV